jgi:hypothetical protein
MLDSQQQKQKFTTFLSFSYLFPIDGILSTPPNTLVIHYWTGDVGGERRRKGGTVTKEKKKENSMTCFCC